MPIIELQRRMRQLGEIRIGHTVDTGRISDKTNKPILRPEKLQIFRLTSASRPLLEEVAKLYGGTVQPWTPANGGPTEWEVYTEADRLPVLVPPREPVTQWYEQYKGSKCVRRCDGVTEQKADQPCMCNPDKRACQITTRLNVMLRDVPGLGVWLLTTHGYYAAAELPEVAHFLAGTRGYVDAWLSMEEKQVVRDDGKTARFMVPKLDVAVTPAQLLAGQGGIAPAVGQAHTALEAGKGQAAIEAPLTDYAGLITAAVSRDEVVAVWEQAKRDPHADGKQIETAAKARVSELATPPQASSPPAQPTPGNADELWNQIVAAWPGTTSELNDAFPRAMGGLTTESASAANLDTFLTKLRAGELDEPAPALDKAPF